MEIKTILIKNDFYNHSIQRNNNFKKEYVDCKNITDVGQLVSSMRSIKHDIIEKPQPDFSNISSFNFSRDVFNKSKWTDLSKIARGLFINIKTEKIVARGFNKFFNYEEHFFNSKSWLKNNLKFPLYQYEKINGYLGILGYDEESDSLLFCTKSCLSAWNSLHFSFASHNFQAIFMEKYKDELESIKKYLKENNCNFVFEVVDPIEDPHIIQYDFKHVVLIDCIYRTIDFNHVSYDKLVDISKIFNFSVKKLINTINSFDDLLKIINDNEKIMDESLGEGYVFEDQNLYMFKLKTSFYNTWKSLRSIKNSIKKIKAGSKKLGCLTSPLKNNFINWCLTQNEDYILMSDIITLRNKFYEDFNN